MLRLGTDSQSCSFVAGDGKGSCCYGEVLAPGKQPNRVKARSFLCYWGVRELGMSCTVIAERLGMTQPGVSRAVQRGERLAESDNFEFIQDEKRIL